MSSRASPSQTSTAIRNPRRRQRPSTEDISARQQQPQRKRHKANGDGFRATTEQDEDISTTKMNGHASHQQAQAGSTTPALEMPVRGKRVLKRRDEGSITLMDTANYVVKQMPALPESMRLNKQDNYRASFLPSTSTALALTRTQAFVWDYNSASSKPSTRTFSLQHPTKPDEPLPFGSLVAPNSGSETGLVVIHPVTGRITYWESIENADALSLFEQRRNGITGSCGSLLSGEVLVGLRRSEPGFMLHFSTGRIAQVLLRDAQSRPSISVHFLNTNQSQTSSGFFGGLKNVFGVSQWIKDVVAIQTRSSSDRGYTEAILALKQSHFQIWQLGWNGQASLQAEVDARAAIEAAVTSAVSLPSGQADQISIVDFAVSTTSASHSTALVANGDIAESTPLVDVVVLVAVKNDADTAFALVELEITTVLATARRTISLNSYTSSSQRDSDWHPRLYLPGSQDTAMVVFQKAILLVSLATIHISPEAQILMDEHIVPEPFQDCLYLKEASHYGIAGGEVEPGTAASTAASIILFVQNCGVIRVSTAIPAEDDDAIQRSHITAKSRIEQAVFFGSIVDNPLDLQRVPRNIDSIEQFEDAASKISREVLGTDTTHLSSVAPSMEQHLEQRARILHQLASYMGQFKQLSRAVRWKLCCDAEKVAAARAVWAIYDRQVASEASEPLLTRLLFVMTENIKTEVDPNYGERDRVRHYFLKDLWRLEYLIVTPPTAIAYLEQENQIADAQVYFRYLCDASDIVLACLETAFQFRQDNVGLYGLQAEDMEEGLLKSNYDGLPEFWTSTFGQQKQLPNLINTIRDRLKDDHDVQQNKNLARNVTKSLPRLIDVYCKGAVERFRWYSARPEVVEQQVATEFFANYEKERSALIRKLRHVGLAKEGLMLGEKYNDLFALVIIIHSLTTTDLIKRADAGDSAAKDELRDVESHVRRYFDVYGDEWMNVFFDYQISQNACSSLLEYATSYGPELTRYLRASKKRRKLSWINDVICEKDYASASKALLHVSNGKENDLWTKKVQLSISKLSLIAGDTPDRTSSTADVSAQNNALDLVKIQGRLYEHIRHCFYDAVDQEAELQIAMEHFGRHIGKSKTLRQLLQRGLESLITHHAMDAQQLIDVLSLMDRRPCELKKSDIAGEEPFLALSALRLAPTFDDTTQNLLLRMILRRCFIRDDWRSLDSAGRKSDQDAMDNLESTTLFQTLYEGYRSGLWNQETGIRVLSPTEVLGAGTTPDEHRYRFNETDIREGLAKDLATEDGVLQNCINKYRLAHWVETATQWAEKRAKTENSTENAGGEDMHRVVAELEEETKEFDKYKHDGE